MVLRMFIVSMVMGCLLFGGSVGAQSGNCPSNVDYLTQAHEQFDVGAYPEALTSYTCAVDADRLDDVAHMGRLQSALLAGDYLTAYAEIFLLNDSAPDVVQQTIQRLTDAMAADPETTATYQIRAFLYMFSGQPEMALADTGRILELESESAFAFLIQASAHELLGKVEEAGAAFATAIEYAPENPQP